MNKIINNTFLKELIDSDFIFSKSNFQSKSSNFFIKSIKTSPTSNFNILDVFKLNKSLKQFIRILYFLKENKNFKIYIWSSNKYLLCLVNKFVAEYKLQDFVCCSISFPVINSTKENLKLLFIMGNPSIQDQTNLINNRMLFNDILLVNKLNFKQERYNAGTYKIQNELSDYKKILFLLVLIHNALSIKN